MSVRRTVQVPFQGRERECPVCGKTFILYEDWAYRKHRGDSELILCSWGCLRKAEKGDVPQSVRNERLIQAIKDGLTNMEIMAMFGEYTRRIEYWRRKIAKEEQKDERETGSESGSAAD